MHMTERPATTVGIVDLIERQVRATIGEVIEAEVAAACAEAETRIRKRMAASVDAIALQVLREYSVEESRGGLFIHVKKDVGL